jgi:hypothetical protein
LVIQPPITARHCASPDYTLAHPGRQREARDDMTEIKHRAVRTQNPPQVSPGDSPKRVGIAELTEM